MSWIFDSFWTFAGFCFVVSLLLEGVCDVIRAWRGGRRG